MRMLTSLLMLLLAMLAGGIVGNWWALGRSPPLLPATTHTGLTIDKLQPLSSLITARVEVADVIETTLNGYTGSLKAAILVKGDFLLGTDLASARFEAIDSARRTARLVLPAPAAASPRVDHARTRVFSISTGGLWQIVPGDQATTAIINRAYADAQKIISAAAQDRALLDRSRHQAESVLRTFFSALGWEVEVRWERP